MKKRLKDLEVPIYGDKNTLWRRLLEAEFELANRSEPDPAASADTPPPPPAVTPPSPTSPTPAAAPPADIPAAPPADKAKKRKLPPIRLVSASLSSEAALLGSSRKRKVEEKIEDATAKFTKRGTSFEASKAMRSTSRVTGRRKQELQYERKGLAAREKSLLSWAETRQRAGGKRRQGASLARKDDVDGIDSDSPSETPTVEYEKGFSAIPADAQDREAQVLALDQRRQNRRRRHARRIAKAVRERAEAIEEQGVFLGPFELAVACHISNFRLVWIYPWEDAPERITVPAIKILEEVLGEKFSEFLAVSVERPAIHVVACRADFTDLLHIGDMNHWILAVDAQGRTRDIVAKEIDDAASEYVAEESRSVEMELQQNPLPNHEKILTEHINRVSTKWEQFKKSRHASL